MNLFVVLIKRIGIQMLMVMVSHAMHTQLRSVAKTAEDMMVVGAQMEVDAQTMGDQQHLQCQHKGHYLKK